MHPSTTSVLFWKPSPAGKPGVASTCGNCKALLGFAPRVVCPALCALRGLVGVSCPCPSASQVLDSKQWWFEQKGP